MQLRDEVRADPTNISPNASPTVLVASDGSAAAQLAMHGAAAVAAGGAPVRVVSVLPPITSIAPGIGVMSPELCLPLDPRVDAGRRAERERELRGQLGRIDGADRWPLEVRVGSPARTVADAASECGATLVVVGLTRHSALDRVLRRENALQIVRESPVPVLALPGAFPARPRRIVVGVDFTPTSIAAARAALDIAAPDAMVQLVHVRETPEPSIDLLAEWYAAYQRSVPTMFALLESRIELPPGVRFHRAVVDGEIAEKLLEAAEHWDAELIVAAAHGGGVLKRFVVGSVTTELMRRTTRPLLVVPPPRRPIT